MVTKLASGTCVPTKCSVLAKIFMVTKPVFQNIQQALCSVLAKIFMVTKPQKYGSTFLNVIEY